MEPDHLDLDAAGDAAETTASAAGEQPGIATSNPIERLHRLGRHGGRSPLYVITIMDRNGHLLDAAAYDPEEYAEYR